MHKPRHSYTAATDLGTNLAANLAHEPRHPGEQVALG